LVLKRIDGRNGREINVSRAIKINVRGLPHPQGSMRAHALPNGKVAMRYPPAVYQWRSQVQQACADAMSINADNGTYGNEIEPFKGAIELRLGFDLPRPQGHYGTGRNSSQLKPSAPSFPVVIPDLDKLVRCICDAITDSGLWKDDSVVCAMHCAKRYANPPGVLIQILELE
jgi:Holliday junction resolvase RusA-like endonuclease